MAVKKKKKKRKQPDPTPKPKRKVKKTKKSLKITSKGLSDDIFCSEYIKDFNGTRAAKAASGGKSSDKTAATQAWKLLRKVEIREKLRGLIAKRAKTIKINTDEVLREVAQMAMADIGSAFSKDNTLKAIHDIPENLRRVISGVKTIELYKGTGENKKLIGYTKEIKFWNKVKSVEMLVKHLGLFLKDNKQQGESFAEGLHKAYMEMKGE